jgi:hypothetical protein
MILDCRRMGREQKMRDLYRHGSINPGPWIRADAFKPIEGSRVFDKGAEPDCRHRRHRLIGPKTVSIPRQGRHGVVTASPQSGVNTITCEGLEKVMAGAHVVIDLANSL